MDMTKDLEHAVEKIWTKLDEIQENEKELDKRLTVHEERSRAMQKDVSETKENVKTLDENLKTMGATMNSNINKLEVKMAYAAGGFAVAVIIAQMIIQISLK